MVNDKFDIVKITISNLSSKVSIKFRERVISKKDTFVNGRRNL